MLKLHCNLCGQELTKASGNWNIVFQYAGCMGKTDERFRSCTCCKERIGEAIEKIADERIKERQAYSNFIAVRDFIKKKFGRVQMFNTPSWTNDKTITIYDKDGITVDYCPGYQYIEIYGLSQDDFDRLNKELGFEC